MSLLLLFNAKAPVVAATISPPTGHLTLSGLAPSFVGDQSAVRHGGITFRRRRKLVAKGFAPTITGSAGRQERFIASIVGEIRPAPARLVIRGLAPSIQGTVGPEVQAPTARPAARVRTAVKPAVVSVPTPAVIETLEAIAENVVAVAVPPAPEVTQPIARLNVVGRFTTRYGTIRVAGYPPSITGTVTPYLSPKQWTPDDDDDITIIAALYMMSR